MSLIEGIHEKPYCKVGFWERHLNTHKSIHSKFILIAKSQDNNIWIFMCQKCGAVFKQYSGYELMGPTFWYEFVGYVDPKSHQHYDVF